MLVEGRLGEDGGEKVCLGKQSPRPRVSLLSRVRLEEVTLLVSLGGAVRRRSLTT